MIGRWGRTAGVSELCGRQATYSDCWEAVVWAMVLVERLAAVEGTRVIPVDPNELTGEWLEPTPLTFIRLAATA